VFGTFAVPAFAGRGSSSNTADLAPLKPIDERKGRHAAVTLWRASRRNCLGFPGDRAAFEPPAIQGLGILADFSLSCGPGPQHLAGLDAVSHKIVGGGGQRSTCAGCLPASRRTIRSNW